MAVYLDEDHENTKASLEQAAQIREESKTEMNEFNVKNKAELNELEEEVKNLQNLINEGEKKHSALKDANE